MVVALPMPPRTDGQLLLSRREWDALAHNFRMATDVTKWKTHILRNDGTRLRVHVFRKSAESLLNVLFYVKHNSRWLQITVATPEFMAERGLTRAPFEQLFAEAMAHHEDEPRQRPHRVRVPTAPGEPVRG